VIQRPRLTFQQGQIVQRLEVDLFLGPEPLWFRSSVTLQLRGSVVLSSVLLSWLTDEEFALSQGPFSGMFPP